MKGYLYILECSNNKYYCGSTVNLERRLKENFSGIGANYTRRYPPKKLAYYEEFQSIDKAFQKEKQIQGWSHKK